MLLIPTRARSQKADCIRWSRTRRWSTTPSTPAATIARLETVLKNSQTRGVTA
jgi:hypothetical protein